MASSTAAVHPALVLEKAAVGVAPVVAVAVVPWQVAQLASAAQRH